MTTVSLKDVAALAGVSAGTVSNVLNGSRPVASATAARVHRAIETLGYVRNDAARQLRAGRSHSIGLVVLDLTNPFFGDVVAGAEDVATEAGYTVLVTHSRDSPEREATQVALFAEQRVHGLLLSPVGDAGPSIARLRPRGIPVVLVDRAMTDTIVSSVSVDDVAGGALACGHLIARGGKRVTFVGGPMGIRQVRDRLEGARKAVSEHSGVKIDVWETPELSVAAGRAAGRHIADLSPADRPDAVFAANDLLAFGVLQSLMLSGDTRVPGDIMLVGYDDIDFAQAAVVPLTSVGQPARLIGETAMRLLLSEAEPSTKFAPRQVIHQPMLAERASTRR